MVSKFKMKALDAQLKQVKEYRAQFQSDCGSSFKSFKNDRSNSPKTPKESAVGLFSSPVCLDERMNSSFSSAANKIMTPVSK